MKASVKQSKKGGTGGIKACLMGMAAFSAVAAVLLLGAAKIAVRHTDGEVNLSSFIIWAGVIAALTAGIIIGRMEKGKGLPLICGAVMGVILVVCGGAGGEYAARMWFIIGCTVSYVVGGVLGRRLPKRGKWNRSY